MLIYRGFLAVSLVSVIPFARAATAPESLDTGVSSTFSIAHQTQVPGDVLKPGEYSIQIVEHISDRMIVRIDGAQGKEHLLFLGVPNLDSEAGSTAPGVQTWRSDAGSLPTLRGFTFPTGTAVDFVYPKAEAAALAKANAATIVAIDPESEGRPSKLKNLSSDDMREINLWMLTLTATGPDNKVPALEAKRYQASSPTHTQTADAPATPRSVQPPQPQATPSYQPTQVAKLSQEEAPQTKSPRRKPAVSELPHTASWLPVICLAGFGSLLAGVVLAFRRTSFGTVR